MLRRRGLLLATGGMAMQPPSPSAFASSPVDVTSFGAVGDGEIDDTKAIQRAVEEACGTSRWLVFPKAPTAYRMGRIRLQRTLSIDLGGSRLQLVGPNAGFFLDGSIFDFFIGNGEIWGDGLLDNKQCGVLTSGVRDLTSSYDGFRASDLVIGNVTIGLALDGICNAKLRRIKINGTLGTEARSGYGIAFGKGDTTNCENITVEDCEFLNTTRHGLYIAGARNVQVRRLKWFQHAHSAEGSHYRSALAISRSHDVDAQALTFIGCNDECIGIDDDQGGYTTRAIALSDVAIRQSRDIVIRISTAAPWEAGRVEVEKVSITNLDVEWEQEPRTHPIVIGEAKSVKLEKAKLRSVGPSIGGLIWLKPDAVLHRTETTVRGIEAEIPEEESLIFIPESAHRGTESITISDISCRGGRPLVFEGPLDPTNSNLRFVLLGIVRDISGSEPSVAGASSFRLFQPAVTRVRSFSHGYPNQLIDVEFMDDLSILEPGVLQLRGGKERSPSRGTKCHFRWSGDFWVEEPPP